MPTPAGPAQLARYRNDTRGEMSAFWTFALTGDKTLTGDKISVTAAGQAS